MGGAINGGLKNTLRVNVNRLGLIRDKLSDSARTLADSIPDS